MVYTVPVKFATAPNVAQDKPADVPPVLAPEPAAPQIHVQETVPDPLAAKSFVQDLFRSAQQDIVTQQDTADFIKALYEGTQFTKMYQLVPGVYITFRELTPQDNIICQREKSVEPNVARMVAAISKYENNHTNSTFSLRTVSELEYDRSRFETPIPELIEWLSARVLKTQGLFNMALQLYEQFSALLQQLYDKAKNPDFFTHTQTAASSEPCSETSAEHQSSSA